MRTQSEVLQGLTEPLAGIVHDDRVCLLPWTVDIVLSFYCHSARHGHPQTTAHSHPLPERQMFFSLDLELRALALNIIALSRVFP